MSVTKLTLGFFATMALMLNTSTAQATILIDGDNNNGDFQTINGGVVNNAKIKQWDLAGNDIDNWTEWTDHPTYTAMGDSGVEGTQVGFLQPGNATYNLTSYQAQVGDTLAYSFEKILSRDFAGVSFNLLFDNGSGTIVESTASPALVSAGNEGLALYSATYTVQAGDDLVGRTIGVGFYGATDYPNLDNVRLVVPEPASLLLLAGCGLVLVGVRKR